MKEVTLKEIENNHQDLTEFKFKYDTYKKNTTLRSALNSMFGTKFKQVFNSKEVSITKDSIDWGGCHIIVVTEKNKVLHWMNSEWADFEKLN